MTWILIGLGMVASGILAVWWLERPLWHKVNGIRGIESFLADLVSPMSPWPLMYVETRAGKGLLFSRERITAGFRLGLELLSDAVKSEPLGRIESKLRAANFPADQISISDTDGRAVLRLDVGQVGRSTLLEAAQAARIILGEIGVAENEVLRARYAGTMDQFVVAPPLERLAREGGPIARLIAKAGLSGIGRR